MSPIPGFEGVPEEVIQAMLRGEEPPEMPPAPPTFTPPELLAAPRPDYLGRLGLGLAGVQGPQVTAGSSPGQALVSGLLSGGARSVAANASSKAAAAAKATEAANAANKSAADRNYENARETWRAKVQAHYRAVARRDGKVQVTRKMAEDMGAPGTAGTWADPMDIAKEVNKRGGMGRADKDVAGVLSVPEGTPVETSTILGARRLLKEPTPKPTPKPKGVTPTEKRRTVVARVVAKLAASGMADEVGIESYFNQPGVADTLASYGASKSDLLRAVGKQR